MQKKPYVKKLDSIALSVALFMLTVIIYSRFISNTVYCVALSCLTILALLLIYNAATKSKRIKSISKKSELNHMNKIFQNLVLYSNEYVDTFFSQLLSSAGYQVETKDNHIFAKKNDINFVVVYLFDAKSINKNNIYSSERIKNKTGADAFLLFCQESSVEAKDALKTLNNSNNIIFCKYSLYKEMKKQEFYPKIDYDFNVKKRAFKEILNYSFNRARFKSYFTLAIIMYAFSYISPFKSYYLIFAAVLFSFAAFSILNRTFNSAQIQTYSEF